MKTNLMIGLSGLLLSACAPTAHERLGDVARYAPAYAGYVIGDDRDAVVLRDPVTSEKLRCRDEIERAAPALAEALESAVHDRHTRAASSVILGPFTVAGQAATMLGTGLLYPAAAVLELASTPQPRALYDEARAAFAAKRFEEARSRFLAVVVIDGRGGVEIDNLPPRWVELSAYYLALSDEALHRDEEARDAFTRFLTMSISEHEARYRDAEARLARLDEEPVPGCASRADFTFTWRRPR